ncbi:hypothetical protein FRUB_03414 [Fimbriiglobus ruber]|uniref:Uncharacterized protein n=1 Tax=Fimbriiglobus ruber TaxID=1908690 RepID=A0A225E561_9BACT|nr:hypothetical protein FRUB_03414 [Fimbriiglobus ruber]
MCHGCLSPGGWVIPAVVPPRPVTPGQRPVQTYRYFSLIFVPRDTISFFQRRNRTNRPRALPPAFLVHLTRFSQTHRLAQLKDSMSRTANCKNVCCQSGIEQKDQYGFSNRTSLPLSTAAAC